ncbi:MAG: hypothetical protein EZS28_046398 [Streblomastix strix]|uniref:Uncharacterized protein n=1 Tax=Streblomastix strix TaxID=222440 RepID=A0A5J4TKN7_9EUKA|nr:MAG: hypothetical protein EZS28_046398 [Streblomastix strix]
MVQRLNTESWKKFREDEKVRKHEFETMSYAVEKHVIYEDVKQKKHYNKQLALMQQVDLLAQPFWLAKQPT